MRNRFLSLVAVLLSAGVYAQNAPASQAGDPISLKSDADVGKKYSEQVDKQYKASTNAAYQERLNRIGVELAKIANENQVKVLWGNPKLNKFEYHFKVLEGEDINAFSLPGGYLYFFEGLMKYVSSDDELAGVVAHEISHASFRHLYTLQKEQSKMDVIRIPMILAALLAGGETGGGVASLAELVGTAIGSGWSQKAEEAADYGGYQYMAKSKYSPLGMLTFLERLTFDENNKPSIDWGIFRTHPPSRERAEAIIKHLNDDAIPIKRSLVSDAYRTILKAGKQNSVEAWFDGNILFTFAGENAQERAERAAKALNDFTDGVPDLFDVTVSSDGTIRGRGRALFKISEEDASFAKTSVAETTKNAVKSLKQSLFMLSFKITDDR